MPVTSCGTAAPRRCSFAPEEHVTRACNTKATACVASDLTGSSSPYHRIQLPGVLYDAHERQRDTVTVCSCNHGAEERVQEVEVGAEEDGVEAVEAHERSV